jgi:alpha-2-macroglobulin
MSAPIQSIPQNQEQGLPPVETITLTFSEPLKLQELSQMLSIELRPLPGISSKTVQWLSSQDFEIKAMERASRQDPASYVISLDSLIGLGTRAIVHLRLSLDDQKTESFAEITFTSVRFTLFGRAIDSV